MSEDISRSLSEPARPLRHSAFGIASFVISLMAGIGESLLLVLSGILYASTGGDLDSRSSMLVGLGCLIIGGILLGFIGAALGIVGLVEKERKRVFAILGLIFSAVIVIGVLAVIVVGRTQ